MASFFRFRPNTCSNACFKSWSQGRQYASMPRVYPRKGEKVIIGLSGGVDSSVAARLLAEQDVDLSAVFMRNWDTRDETGTDKGCEWEKDWEDVQRVCRMLDIPCKMIDLSREYWLRVFQPSLDLWESGATPNPDVWCNREIKFGALFDRLVEELGTGMFATGHYAQRFDALDSNNKRRPQLHRGVDRSKDQSFYLSSIKEDALSRTIFPIGHLTKADVRELARKYSLPTAERAESMGLCFVGERGRFNKFLGEYIQAKPGPIIDLETMKTIGSHTGLWTYTIGEKARLPGMPVRMCVAKKSRRRNAIYVVPGTNHPALWRTSVLAKGWRWIWADAPPDGILDRNGYHARVMFRHRMLDVAGTVRQLRNQSLSVTFDEPQKAIAPGQVIAVWDGDWCLGCGTIVESFQDKL